MKRHGSLSISLAASIMISLLCACSSAPASYGENNSRIAYSETTADAWQFPPRFSIQKRSSTSKNMLPPIEAPSQQECREAKNQYNERIRKIVEADKADKINNMTLTSVTRLSGGRNKPYKLVTTDSNVISQWVKLIGDIQVSAIPYDTVVGDVGYGLTFSTDTEELDAGSGFTFQYIYFNEENARKVMFRFSNYEQLNDRLKVAETAIGFPMSSK